MIIVEMVKFKQIMKFVIQMIQAKQIGERMDVVQVVKKKTSQNLKLHHCVVLHTLDRFIMQTIQLRY